VKLALLLLKSREQTPDHSYLQQNRGSKKERDGEKVERKDFSPKSVEFLHIRG
jgi:hypothetical protein